jgi:hypothetical protein
MIKETSRTAGTTDMKETTRKLQVLQACETWSSRLLGGWLPGVSVWEAKHQIGRVLWDDIQTARDLRTRLWELRLSKPDRMAEKEAITLLMARMASCQNEFEFVAGLFLGLKRRMANYYQEYLETAHPVWDGPTIPLLEAAQLKLERQCSWAEDFLAEQEKSQETGRWREHIENVITASGVFGGEFEQFPSPPPAYECQLPFPEAKRDDRFETSLTGFERPEIDDHSEHSKWQFANYAMEMQAAETLGSVMWEAEEMEWEFYYDVARHCYDECRHCQMGEERLKELGFALAEFPQFVGNYAWRQLYDPMRRYGMLTYIIEQDSFALKHETYKKYQQQGDLRSAEAILYDIIDETMHVRWGVKWLPKLMEAQGETASLKEVIEQCRQAVLENSLSPAQRAYGTKGSKKTVS